MDGMEALQMEKYTYIWLSKIKQIKKNKNLFACSLNRALASKRFLNPR
jgi:hypothetical protein